MALKIEGIYTQQLPQEYIHFLKENPAGDEITFSEYKDDPEDEGRYWNLMGEEELLKTWEMKGVGTAANFECLKLYVQLQKEFGQDKWAFTDNGKVELSRVESGFVIGEENGDYLYLDASDNFSVWIYHHDGGDVKKIADSFADFIK